MPMEQEGRGETEHQRGPSLLGSPHLQGILPENRLEKDIPSGDLGIQKVS